MFLTPSMVFHLDHKGPSEEFEYEAREVNKGQGINHIKTFGLR